MKKVYLVIMFLYALNASSQEAWERITPLPQENFINSITKFPATDRLIAVCDKSTIMTSDDGGESWQFSFNPAGKVNDYDCKFVCFINKTTGFIAGSNESLLKTIDGGITWQERYSTNTEYNFFEEIEFVNDSTGFAIGYQGSLVKTTDQGDNWLPAETGTDYYLASIEFFDELNGMIACIGNSIEDGQVLVTSDGGTTWELQANPSGIPVDFVIRDIHKLNNNIILTSAIPKNGNTIHIFKSTDNGLTWTDKFSLPGTYNLKFASFDPLNCVAGGNGWEYKCRLVKTSDGGESWEVTTPENFYWYSTESLCYFDSLNILTVGSYGKYYKSYDGGSLWERKDIHLNLLEIQKTQFLNDSTGYAVGKEYGGGVASCDIMKTFDGGATWTWLDQYFQYPAINFISIDTGYLIDRWSEDNLAYTTDGGFTWTRRTVEFEGHPSDFTIKFLNNEVGILTADDEIKYTKNAGNTWYNCAPYTDALLYYKDIEWLAPDETLIIGGFADDVSVMVKVNVEMNWLNEFITLGMYGMANDIEFINDSIGFIGCSNNVILKTTDRALSWTPTNILNTEGFNVSSINFITEDTGYAVGSGQYTNMLKTTDGGNTWYPLNTLSTSGINSMHFFDENTGYVFGQYGLMLHTTTGGVVGTKDIMSHFVSNDFIVYPNPVKGTCSLMFIQSSTSPEICMIYDIRGNLVKCLKLESTDPVSFDMNFVNNGIYIFKVIYQDGKTTGCKVVKGM